MRCNLTVHPQTRKLPWSPSQFYVNQFYRKGTARIGIESIDWLIVESRLRNNEMKCIGFQKKSIKLILLIRAMVIWGRSITMP